MIEQKFSLWTQTEIMQRLESANIANARVNEIQDLWQHPQLQARQRWIEVDSPVGKIPTLKPVGLSNAGDFTVQAIPSLGQHTLSILNELDFNPEYIQSLELEGII